MSTEDALDDLIKKLFVNPEEYDEQKQEELDSPTYPEQLLHLAPQGNRYYHSLQQYKRQFSDDSSEGRVINFSNSNLNTLQQQKVGSWDGQSVISEKHKSPKSIPSVSKAANALFAWSSGDEHIRARKEELRSRSGSPGPSIAPSRPVSVNRPRAPSFPVRLHQIAEKESNRFIQDRINLIEAHRLEQASKRVTERKQRDHDRHIERMKKKEEEDSKAFNDALKLKRESKNLNFFGNLFSFAKSGKNASSMDESRSTSDLNTITSTKSSLDSASMSRSPSMASMGKHSLNPDAVHPSTPTSDTFKTAAVSPVQPTTPASRSRLSTLANETETEPAIVGIDDAFASLDGSSSKSPAKDQIVDDILDSLSPSPKPSAPTSPQKHRFIPLGSVHKQSLSVGKIDNDSDDLLKL